SCTRRAAQPLIGPVAGKRASSGQTGVPIAADKPPPGGRRTGCPGGMVGGHHIRRLVGLPGKGPFPLPGPARDPKARLLFSGRGGRGVGAVDPPVPDPEFSRAEKRSASGSWSGAPGDPVSDRDTADRLLVAGGPPALVPLFPPAAHPRRVRSSGIPAGRAPDRESTAGVHSGALKTLPVELARGDRRRPRPAFTAGDRGGLQAAAGIRSYRPPD